ncbi:MAG: APC family permease [Gammaproteobacteria bacterium]
MHKRSISTTALLFMSVSAIIGSGWLFSSFYASTLAGPAAILSWILAGIAVIIIAFVFGELCSMLPITGSSTRIPHFTHGTVVSFIFSWIIWLSYAAMAPVETQAIVQYLDFYFPHLVNANNSLSSYGYIFASTSMLIFSVINIYSLRWLIKSNNFLTILKICIPTGIAITLIAFALHHGHKLYPEHSTFAPLGLSGILTAISSGGIIFAFNGFKQAAEMAGEAKKPHIALPIALIGSVALCLIIFLLLQIAFLYSVNSSNIVNGWANLTLPANTSPLAAIMAQNNIHWLFPFLYSCAILAPAAAALMYVSSSSRSLYGMSKNGYIPRFFQKLNTEGNPSIAITANFLIGMLMFAPLPGWDKMVSFLSSILAVTYTMGPIALLSLRRQVPNQPRYFRLPFSSLWSVVALYICTLLIYWCGWNIIYKLSLALCIGLITLLIYQVRLKLRGEEIKLNWQASIWMWVYFLGLTLLSYLGKFGDGIGVLPFGWDFLVIAVFSVLVAFLAIKFKLPAHETKAHILEIMNCEL